jgi:hypothetical protein
VSSAAPPADPDSRGHLAGAELEVMSLALSLARHHLAVLRRLRSECRRARGERRLELQRQALCHRMRCSRALDLHEASARRLARLVPSLESPLAWLRDPDRQLAR